MPSLSPALRPCRKQWSSSFPLDPQDGGADPQTHPFPSQGGSAGSLLDDRDHMRTCLSVSCTDETA